MPLPNTQGSFRTDVAEMQIGDYIACQYNAGAGVAGTFSNLGTDLITAQANEIPVVGAIAPNGFFYFIKVATHLLIADRNIQHSIMWSTLHAKGYIDGFLFSPDILIRSLDGGVSYIDSNNSSAASYTGLGGFPYNNEWDKYIENDNLNNKINAGDDLVWNHHRNVDLNTGLYTLCKTRKNDDVVARCIATQANVSYNKAKIVNSTSITTATSTWGFRPVLQLINYKQTNHFY